MAEYREGQTATNPKTGQRLRYEGGFWVAVPGSGPAKVPKLTTQDADALASARRDAEAADRMARQADRFMGYNQQTGTGGLRNTKIDIWPFGTVVDVPAIMSMTSPNWGAMESITAATAPKDRVEGSGSTSDFEARMNLIGFPNVNQRGDTNTETTRRIKDESARARARAAFMDRWAADRGTLLGADTAFVQWWDRYSKEKGIGGAPRKRAPSKPAPSKGYRVLSVE